MTIVWPDGVQTFQQHVVPGEYLNVTGPMVVDYSEPDWNDFPGNVTLDSVARSLTFVGPIDMWTWSRDQTAHANLASEWVRVGLLPYGAPTIEFRMTGEPEATLFSVTDYASPVTGGESSAFNVTVLDQFGEVYPDYTGTIEFSSNDSAAVVSPASYTFTALDAGIHEFPSGVVTFNTGGYHDLSVVDSVDPTLAGAQLMIEVIEPPRMDHFEVTGIADPSIANYTVSDVTVQAFDQFGDPFSGYLGTVQFSSTDAEATLPANYPFVAGDLGLVTFLASVMLTVPGDQTVTVEDTLDAAITGEMTVTVLPEPVPTYFLVYGISNTPMLDVAESVTVEVMDQYDHLYPGYDGTVVFSTNRTGEVTLPANYAFDPLVDMGVHTYVDEVTFSAGGYFTVTATDQADASSRA
jgi:hypothetical protein